jgi:bacterioferritin-associated ferredoxin
MTRKLGTFFAILALSVITTALIAAEAGNKNCPISGKAVDASQTSTVKTVIGVCCGNCAKKAKANPAGVLAKATADQAVNSKCPLSGKAINASKTVSYNGATVGVCCGNCLKKATADSSILDGKVTYDTAGNSKCPISGKPINASKNVSFETTVGFCCGNCKKKFDANPAKFIAKVK